MDGDGRGWREAGWRGAELDGGGRGWGGVARDGQRRPGWDGAGWRGAGMDDGGRGWGKDKAGRRQWMHVMEKEERGKKKRKKLIPLTCGSHV